MAEKIDRIRAARPWTEREERGETVEIDLDFLVDRLRDLSIEMQADAADQRETLERALRLQPGLERALLRELELLALDLAPGLDPRLSDLGRGGRLSRRGGRHPQRDRQDARRDRSDVP